MSLGLMFALGGVACDGGGEEASSIGGSPPAVSGPGVGAPGTPAAPIVLSQGPARSLSGEPLERVGLDELRQVIKGLEGKPVVLHLWVGWGGPERELRALTHLHGEFGEQVEFLGVCAELLNRPDTTKTMDGLRAHLKTSGVEYSTVLYTGEEEGLFEWSGAKEGLPSTLILGPDGALWARYLRPVKAGDVLDTLKVYGAVPEEAPEEAP